MVKEKKPRRLFHFRAHYMTRAGNMGSATLKIRAADHESAMSQGIARVERRKAYAGKLSADVSEIKETVK
jgi:hypothetical protein